MKEGAGNWRDRWVQAGRHAGTPEGGRPAAGKNVARCVERIVRAACWWACYALAQAASSIRPHLLYAWAVVLATCLGTDYSDVTDVCSRPHPPRTHLPSPSPNLLLHHVGL